MTPYVRFGDWLCWLSVIAAIGILALAITRRNQSPHT
jgi:apolipoprotein N-acyltransferase